MNIYYSPMIRIMMKNINSFSKYNKNYYETLGVSHNATNEEIKLAYYKLAKIYHPDISPNHLQQFKDISEAYNSLRDPLKVTGFVNRENNLIND